jgi:tRNA(Ile)-lysidine synthase
MDQAECDGVILPPQATAWSREHLRLHRSLQRQPELLPQGAALLLAVSGGQDSMALLGLLLGLQRLHDWRLVLWHGDHGWRDASARQADELARWCAQRGLMVIRDADSGESAASEARARAWRYERLLQRAREQGCSHVVTGHTASDRAETLLLHLARGSHRRGLASLRTQRSLGDGVALSRPLLLFSRSETARICRDLDLPIWLDASNSDRRFSRNRLRHEVLPVLEQLHPGAARRLSGTAERLSREHEVQLEWQRIALQWLASGEGDGLDRQRLNTLQPVNRAAVLHLWLSTTTERPCQARQLEDLLAQLRPGHGPGQWDLGGGWQLHWDRFRLVLMPPAEPAP